MRSLFLVLALASACAHTQTMEMSAHGTGFERACGADVVIDAVRFEDDRVITIVNTSDANEEVAVLAEDGSSLARTSLEDRPWRGRGVGHLHDDPRAIMIVRLDENKKRVCETRLALR